MNFYNKIKAIEKLLPCRKRKEIKDRLLLACGIYYYIKMNCSFRDLPLYGTNYSWCSFRYWLQRLERLGKMQEIQNIVGGD